MHLAQILIDYEVFWGQQSLGRKKQGTKTAVFGEVVRGRGLRKSGIGMDGNRSVSWTPDVSSGTDGNVFFTNLVNV